MGAYPYGILRRNKRVSEEAYCIPRHNKGVGGQNKGMNGEVYSILKHHKGSDGQPLEQLHIVVDRMHLSLVFGRQLSPISEAFSEEEIGVGRGKKFAVFKSHLFQGEEFVLAVHQSTTIIFQHHRNILTFREKEGSRMPDSPTECALCAEIEQFCNGTPTVVVLLVEYRIGTTIALSNAFGETAWKRGTFHFRENIYINALGVVLSEIVRKLNKETVQVAHLINRSLCRRIG